MTFLSLVIVLLLVQWWGSGKPLQQDEWFFASARYFDRQRGKIGEWFAAAAAIGLPVVSLFAIQCLLALAGWWLWVLVVNVLVLLFSLGRGEFGRRIKEYVEAAGADQSVHAVQILEEMNLDPELRAQREEDDWVQLHADALRVFSYRGFERMFAVIFWFMVLGAAGALAYRLLNLIWVHYLQVNDRRALCVAKALTWVEWPAARLMGIAWAMVGNFELCIKPWRDYCFKAISTQKFLLSVVRGALGDDLSPGQASHVTGATRIEPAYSLGLVKSLESMFSRALLLWVVVVAIVTLMF